MAMREPPHMFCRPRKHTRLSFLTALLLNLTLLSLAFLCMPLEAGELLSNGSFTTGLDGWAASGQIPACGERSWDPGASAGRSHFRMNGISASPKTVGTTTVCSQLFPPTRRPIRFLP